MGPPRDLTPTELTPTEVQQRADRVRQKFQSPQQPPPGKPKRMRLWRAGNSRERVEMSPTEIEQWLQGQRHERILQEFGVHIKYMNMHL